MGNYNWVDDPTKVKAADCNPDILNECLMHLKYNNSNNSDKVNCFTSGRKFNGKADAITVGSLGARPKILAQAVSLTGKYFFNNQINAIQFDQDFEIPKNSPIGRRSSIILKGYSNGDAMTNPDRWDYSCQRIIKGNLPNADFRLNPVMTSNTLPSGTVNASSSYDGSMPAWKAVNGIIGGSGSSDIWVSGTGTFNSSGIGNEWWEYAFASPVLIDWVDITGRYNYAHLEAPVDFTITAYNETSLQWDTLFVKTGESWSSSGNPIKSCYFNNSTLYKRFRINVTKIGGSLGYCSLAEVEFKKQNIALIPNNALLTVIDGVLKDFYNNSISFIGNPVIANSKITCSGSDGFKINSITSLGLLEWSIETKVSFATNNTRYTILSGLNNYCIELDRSANNKLQLWLSSNGSSNDIVNGLEGSKGDFVNNTDYYIRLRFTGSQYEVAWSTDGLNYTKDIVAISSAKVSAIGGIAFGIYAASTSFGLNGTIDPAKTRVTVGNYRVDGEPFIPDIYWCDRDNTNKTFFGSPSNWTEIEAITVGDIANTRYTQLLLDFSESLTKDLCGNPVSVLGNPTLSNGKYVSDGTGDGLKVLYTNQLAGATWRIQFDTKINTSNTYYYLMSSTAQGGYALGIARNAANKLQLYLSTSSSSYNITNGITGTKADFDNTTSYTIALEFTGTAYNLYVNNVLDITVPSTTNINVGLTSGTFLIFGCMYDFSSYSLNGTYDYILIASNKIYGSSAPQPIIDSAITDCQTVAYSGKSYVKITDFSARSDNIVQHNLCSTNVKGFAIFTEKATNRKILSAVTSWISDYGSTGTTLWCENEMQAVFSHYSYSAGQKISCVRNGTPITNITGRVDAEFFLEEVA